MSLEAIKGFFGYGKTEEPKQEEKPVGRFESLKAKMSDAASYAGDKAIAVRDSQITHIALTIGLVVGLAALATGGAGFAAAHGASMGPFSFLKNMGNVYSGVAVGAGALLTAAGAYGAYRIIRTFIESRNKKEEETTVEQPVDTNKNLTKTVKTNPSGKTPGNSPDAIGGSAMWGRKK